MIKAGLLDHDDILREIVTVTEEQRDNEYWADAYDIEDLRKSGIHVDAKEYDDGAYSVISPLNLPRRKIVNFILHGQARNPRMYGQAQVKKAELDQKIAAMTIV